MVGMKYDIEKRKMAKRMNINTYFNKSIKQDNFNILRFMCTVKNQTNFDVQTLAAVLSADGLL